MQEELVVQKALLSAYLSRNFSNLIKISKFQKQQLADSCIVRLKCCFDWRKFLITIYFFYGRSQNRCN